MKFGYVSWLAETDLVRKFIEELRSEKLKGTICQKCGEKYLPPRAHCKCGSTDIEWFEAPRYGRIIAFSIINFAPASMAKFTPYIIAVAELEDGLRIPGHLTGVTPKDLKVGLSIQVAFQKLNEDRIVYKFKP